MRLTIVYDDKKGTNEYLIPDHGFSCYIENKKETILFDTGTNGKILLHNMNILKKDPKNISKIVISHEHYDHNGGLPDLLQSTGMVTVYRIGDEPSSNNVENIKIENPQMISPNIWTTGRLPGHPKDEQSLILKGSKGMFLLTGCSHPEIHTILQTSRTHGEIIGVIGGLHGFNSLDILSSMKYLYPCHCTVHKDKIKETYPQTTNDCFVGTTITI